MNVNALGDPSKASVEDQRLMNRALSLKLDALSAKVVRLRGSALPNSTPASLLEYIKESFEADEAQGMLQQFLHNRISSLMKEIDQLEDSSSSSNAQVVKVEPGILLDDGDSFVELLDCRPSTSSATREAVTNTRESTNVARQEPRNAERQGRPNADSPADAPPALSAAAVNTEAPTGVNGPEVVVKVERPEENGNKQGDPDVTRKVKQEEEEQAVARREEIEDIAENNPEVPHDLRGKQGVGQVHREDHRVRQEDLEDDDDSDIEILYEGPKAVISDRGKFKGAVANGGTSVSTVVAQMEESRTPTDNFIISSSSPVQNRVTSSTSPTSNSTSSNIAPPIRTPTESSPLHQDHDRQSASLSFSSSCSITIPPILSPMESSSSDQQTKSTALTPLASFTSSSSTPPEVSSTSSFSPVQKDANTAGSGETFRSQSSLPLKKRKIPEMLTYSQDTFTNPINRAGSMPPGSSSTGQVGTSNSSSSAPKSRACTASPRTSEAMPLSSSEHTPNQDTVENSSTSPSSSSITDPPITPSVPVQDPPSTARNGEVFRTPLAPPLKKRKIPQETAELKNGMPSTTERSPAETGFNTTSSRGKYRVAPFPTSVTSSPPVPHSTGSSSSPSSEETIAKCYRVEPSQPTGSSSSSIRRSSSREPVVMRYHFGKTSPKSATPESSLQKRQLQKTTSPCTTKKARVPRAEVQQVPDHGEAAPALGPLAGQGAAAALQGEAGRTPEALYQAVVDNKPVNVESLLSCGVPVDYKHKGYLTPLRQAYACNHEECLRLLLSAGADFAPLMENECDTETKRYKTLIDHKNNIELYINKKITPNTHKPLLTKLLPANDLRGKKIRLTLTQDDLRKKPILRFFVIPFQIFLEREPKGCVTKVTINGETAVPHLKSRRMFAGTLQTKNEIEIDFDPEGEHGSILGMRIVPTRSC